MKRVIPTVLAMILLCTSAFAEVSTLSVSGSGTVYMEADHVSACLGVDLSGEDLTELQNQANATVAKICDALQAAGLEEKDISTSHIYISPNYNYSSFSDERKFTGYTISHSLAIITEDADEIGMYIDTAFAAGANSFDSISFSLRDDSEARDKALELAVREAFRKAEVIAAASGKSLEGILEINEGDLNTTYNNSSGAAYKMMPMEAAGTADTTVRAAQVSVNANVQIIFEIK